MAVKRVARLPPRAEVNLLIDPEAALVFHYEKLLQNLARRIGCPHLAADCLQDTWLQLAERQERQSVSNAQAYVYRMACNRAVDILRREGRYVHDDTLIERLSDEVADAAPGPEGLASMRQELERVLNAIEKMPRRQQAICLDIWLADATRAEAARRFGVTHATVSGSIRAARHTAHIRQ